MGHFKHLTVQGWRQFGNIELELHPRLTVLTGANGAGKSSLLRIFSRHFGFDRPYLATPIFSEDGSYTYATGLFVGVLNRFWKRFFPSREDIKGRVGHLVYSDGSEAKLNVPESSSVQYSIDIIGQQHVTGIHIDSHQPIAVFQQVSQIPTTIISPSTAYANYNNEIVARYTGGHTGLSPTYRMKEAIIAMAMFGEGNSQVRGNPDVLRAYRGFIKVLTDILPESLGFIDISIRPPEVVIVTQSGEFLIDASSGGVMTLIDLAWRLHMFSLNQQDFVVTIDEPENHLHPTMQRSLMRRLITAFPKAQFIIATHSPFMVSSVKDSFVYVLRYVDNVTGEFEGEKIMPSENSRVVSQRLDTINKAGSASEILRDVLGVHATIPEWVEEGLSDIVARHRQLPVTLETLNALRAELAVLGYSDHYPEALAALMDGR